MRLDCNIMFCCACARSAAGLCIQDAVLHIAGSSAGGIQMVVVRRERNGVDMMPKALHLHGRARTFSKLCRTWHHGMQWEGSTSVPAFGTFPSRSMYQWLYSFWILVSE